MVKKTITLLRNCSIILFFLLFSKENVYAAALSISSVTVQTPGNIEKYAKFEVSFDITGGEYTNSYYPYDNTPRPTWASGIQQIGLTGISVDQLLLPPGQTNWANAKVNPCFYYQPVEQVGSGSSIALLPVGKTQWRCRFSPDQSGGWQYKIKLADNSGTLESTIQQFTAADPSPTSPTRHGFIRVSQTDKRFFEFSDGTAFTTPLLTSNPGSDIYAIRNNIQKLGTNGIHFIRWFPTDEDGVIVPYGGDTKYAWGFGPTWWKIDDIDSAMGNKFSFAPYYYTNQAVSLKPGAKYKLTFRASLTGERALRVEVQDIANSNFLCTASNALFSSCQSKKDGWNSYELQFTNSGNLSQTIIWIHGLFTNTDAAAPYGEVRNGTIRISSLLLQRDETGQGGWGPNLLSAGDIDTYRYVDQVQAAKLDEVFKQSEQFGVYHKLTVFHKNSGILNAFRPDGSIVLTGDEWDANVPKYFFSAAGQPARWLEEAYERYFIARWSYSNAIHSLEIANEIDYNSWSTSAALALAHFFNTHSPRKILMSTSFFGYWGGDYFYNTDIDYGDKHWYADHRTANCYTSPDSCEPVSSLWKDSAENVRFCSSTFRDYYTWYGGMNKPIVRGETGISISGVNYQDPAIALETTGTYYHKKLWAHLGLLGFSCDGEWWPRLWETPTAGQFPNTTYDNFKNYSAYDKFITGEPLNNGHYDEIGNDLTGDKQITITNPSGGTLRAWGTRDKTNGKALLWVDNATDTWNNVVNNPASIVNASGTITIQGLPAGTYKTDWWNTMTGTITKTENYNVGSDGKLTFIVSSLATDTALKFNNSSTPSYLVSDINQDGYTNSADTLLIFVSWLTGGTTTYNNREDINKDGKVNGMDFGLLVKEWMR